MALEISGEYGWVLLVTFGFYLNHALFLLIPVIKGRKATGFKAPTMYPRDSEIKTLNVSGEDLDYYLRAQRAHQNNIEFMSHFFPVFLILGLISPIEVAIAGAITLLGRIISGVGYLFGKRIFGSFFHFSEWYIVLWMLPYLAYTMITSA